MAWLPIRYRDFYDVPRAFLVDHGDATYFFDCPFDDQADDYPRVYRVYRLPHGSASNNSSSWEGLERLGPLVGHVDVDRVTFDRTRRAAVEDSILESLGVDPWLSSAE